MLLNKEYIEEFTQAARAQGVERLHFYIEESAAHSVEIYSGELERLDRSESCRVFIEGEAEGFAGSVFVEDFQPRHIPEHVQVLRQCALEGKRPFPRHPLASLPEAETPERTFLPLEELVEKLLAAERAARETDSRVEVQGCGFHERYGTITLMDGEGREITDPVGGSHFHLELTAREGDAVQLGYRSVPAPWGQTPDLEALARQAAAETASRLAGGSYPTGPSAVVLDGEVVCQLLDAFAPAFFGKNVQKHMSVLEGRLGERVAGENISLLEDPRLPGGLRCRRFDDEGTPTSAKTILDRGVLRTYLHNWPSAAAEGAAPGGNGFRPSYAQEAATGYTNLYLASGEKSREELLAEMGEGLLITEVSGVFAGARPTTGEFSLIAGGFQVRGGKRGRAVSQITVAGDFFQLLRQVRLVGRDDRWMRASAGSVRAPSLLVESLAISGSALKKVAAPLF